MRPGEYEKTPGGRPGAGVATGNKTSLPPSRPNCKTFHARFACLPPRGTRQSGTRLAVVGGKPRSFKTARQRQQEGNLLALLLGAKPEGWTPIEGPVAVSVKLSWPYRKSERRRVVKAGREIPAASRSLGDLDNELKGILDSCTGAQLIRDDALVAELHASRVWGPSAYWTLDVRELDGGGGHEKAAPADDGERLAAGPTDDATRQQLPLCQFLERGVE